MNKCFIFSLNAKPLFDIQKNFINFFYERLKNISDQGSLVLCTDLNYNNAVKLASEMKLKKGYIITSCGSSIYSIEQNKSLYSSHIKKSNVYPFLRQVAVNFDSIVLHSQKRILVYSNNYELTDVIKKENENIDITSTYDYTMARRFVKNNNIEYIEIFNTNIDTNLYPINNENIIDISNDERLSYNRLSKNRIIITNTSFQEAINYIFKKEKYNIEKYFVKLTDIFNNQNIEVEHMYRSEYSLDDLFKDRIFFLFEKSFNELIDNNHLIQSSEDEKIENVEIN